MSKIIVDYAALQFTSVIIPVHKPQVCIFNRWPIVFYLPSMMSLELSLRASPIFIWFTMPTACALVKCSRAEGFDARTGSAQGMRGCGWFCIHAFKGVAYPLTWWLQHPRAASSLTGQTRDPPTVQVTAIKYVSIQTNTEQWSWYCSLTSISSNEKRMPLKLCSVDENVAVLWHE